MDHRDVRLPHFDDFVRAYDVRELSFRPKMGIRPTRRMDFTKSAVIMVSFDHLSFNKPKL